MQTLRIAGLTLQASALATALSFAFGASPAGAQGLVVYPAQGQSAEQQKKDEGECHVWAVEKSGFDPANAGAVAPAPAPTANAVRGAAGGAAVGAIGGAIGGNAGKGAAIGAGVGAAGGAIRRRSQEKQAASQQQSAQAAQDASRESYQRARAACLEGRGYTVK